MLTYIFFNKLLLCNVCLKQFMTLRFVLQMVILGVWITSAAYSAPKFIWVETITNDLGDGQMETICIPHRRKYNSELFDMVNFGLLYVTPLCVMTVRTVCKYIFQFT